MLDKAYAGGAGFAAELFFLQTIQTVLAEGFSRMGVPVFAAETAVGAADGNGVEAFAVLVPDLQALTGVADGGVTARCDCRGRRHLQRVRPR